MPNASGYTVLYTAAKYGSVNVKTLRVLRDTRLRDVDMFVRAETVSIVADLLGQRGDIHDDLLVVFAEFAESVQRVNPVIYRPLPSYGIPGSNPSRCWGPQCALGIHYGTYLVTNTAITLDYVRDFVSNSPAS